MKVDVVMSDMMGSGMMWGMSVAALIGPAVIILVIAALVKYVFFR
ncbi:hypothetical protein [Rhizobium leguminosarum]